MVLYAFDPRQRVDDLTAAAKRITIPPPQPMPRNSPERALRSVVVTALSVVAIGISATAALGQSDAWFGVRFPPPLTDGAAVILGERPAVPATVPAGEEGFTELEGEKLFADLERTVGFSRQSRTMREIGSGQLWGRITGFASGARTVEWATDQLRQAGIDDTHLQHFDQSAGSRMWLPIEWEVALVGDDAFGSGSADVVLESAMPLADLDVPPTEAALIFVGTASPAELAHLDVRGRIAVQKIIPQGHTVFTRSPAGPRAEDLLERGAVAVLNILDLPANVQTNDMGCGRGPCFNIGGQDGQFIEGVLNAAAEAGRADEIKLRMRVRGQSFSGMTATNGVAVIHGSRGGEPIIVNAHADAWFEGAGDNGDGLAVLLALGRHFAIAGNQPVRDLVFVVSAGHHSSGLSGPSNFIEMNPEIAANALLAINLEHTSQRHITPARSEFEDGYREWVMDSREAPIVAGVTLESPLIQSLISEGIERYGTNFVTGANPMASGEGGSFVRAAIPVFTTMQGPPLYHTTGEVLEMISVPGMERMARFMAFFIRELDRAPASTIAPRSSGR